MKKYFTKRYTQYNRLIFYEVLALLGNMETVLDVKHVSNKIIRLILVLFKDAVSSVKVIPYCRMIVRLRIMNWK